MGVFPEIRHRQDAEKLVRRAWGGWVLLAFSLSFAFPGFVVDLEPQFVLGSITVAAVLGGLNYALAVRKQPWAALVLGTLMAALLVAMVVGSIRTGFAAQSPIGAGAGLIFFGASVWSLLNGYRGAAALRGDLPAAPEQTDADRAAKLWPWEKALAVGIGLAVGAGVLAWVGNEGGSQSFFIGAIVGPAILTVPGSLLVAWLHNAKARRFNRRHGYYQTEDAQDEPKFTFEVSSQKEDAGAQPRAHSEPGRSEIDETAGAETPYSWQRDGKLISSVIGGALLLLAAADQTGQLRFRFEDGFYTFLRIYVSGLALIFAFTFWRKGQAMWLVASMIVAILFNPVLFIRTAPTEGPVYRGTGL